MTEPPTNAATWDAAFKKLKARFPDAKDTIVFCVHCLQLYPDASVDDIKAQAALHSIRITAASVNAARRLMAEAPTTPKETGGAADATPARQRPARRTRAAQAAMDPTSMLQKVIDKLQQQGQAEAERLRAAMQKAIQILQAAVGS